MRFLKESCKELEVDRTNLQKLVEGENWSSECDLSTRIEALTQVKKELESKNGSENAIHFVDILMQHIKRSIYGRKCTVDFTAGAAKWA